MTDIHTRHLKMKYPQPLLSTSPVLH